ncbi:efflux RND transporter periplasmic adaptor subunit [Kosakonia sp.]|uniref:efflux RND transporter periplasmic adaptor subunit n=1 Tax=Kosakonia sp. TaxID=1916651 RepID=UPI0028A06A66|nr:efflux RND transporter periplasmic adaptor subunit [Kosakonia sp.]
MMRYQKKTTLQERITSPSGKVICAFAFSLLLAACDDSQVKTVSLRPVKTWIVSQAQPAPSMTWTGTIEPAEEVTLQFRLNGKLGSKPVDVGASVTKNQTVAQLTATQSAEDTAAALAEYQDAVVAEEKGRQALERSKKLFAIGTVSRAQLEEAVSSLATLTARKVRAQAQKNNALNGSDFSKLQAPFDGRVTAYPAMVGQNISAGQDVLKIASAQAEVQFSVSSELAAALHPGDGLTVLYAGRRLPGHIRYITPQLDSTTRTSLVRASLVTEGVDPVFGTAVSVELAVAKEQVMPLPASALTRAGDQPAVFVVNPTTGALDIRPVSIARFSADKAYVSAGLKTGEKVVTAGVNTLQNGEKVSTGAEAAK